jgi:hypothetical protein
MSAGYTVFLTADLEIGKSEEGETLILWRTTRKIVTEHSPDQWEGLPVPHGYYPMVLKWHNQFAINVPEGYSLLFSNPINRFDLPFQTITGIVDFIAALSKSSEPFLFDSGLITKRSTNAPRIEPTINATINAIQYEYSFIIKVEAI